MALRSARIEIPRYGCNAYPFGAMASSHIPEIKRLKPHGSNCSAGVRWGRNELAEMLEGD
jgi:hypothetical protein